MSGLGVDLRHWQTANFGQLQTVSPAVQIARKLPFV